MKDIVVEEEISNEDSVIPDELEGVIDDSTDMDDDEFEAVEDDEDEQESEENK